MAEQYDKTRLLYCGPPLQAGCFLFYLIEVCSPIHAEREWPQPQVDLGALRGGQEKETTDTKIVTK